MAGVSVTYEGPLPGDGEIDWTPALKRCAVACRASILENFAGAHAPDGTPWAALRFGRVRGGAKPLNDTGLLRASATGVGKAANHIEQIGRLELTFGTNDERARLHQEGGVIRPKRARYLTIPLTKEALRSGGARRMTGLFFFAPRGQSGPKFLAARTGKGKRAKLVLHWLLLDESKIDARPFVGWNAKLEETVANILADHAVNQGFSG